jgi:hypothetical protein
MFIANSTSEGGHLLAHWGCPVKVVSHARRQFYTLDDHMTESFSGFVDEYEVIGNIYENPELQS